jgi:hypothetical protein
LQTLHAGIDLLQVNFKQFIQTFGRHFFRATHAIGFETRTDSPCKIGLVAYNPSPNIPFFTAKAIQA